jgi:diguanylate cyclase (GGDEF)-like protein
MRTLVPCWRDPSAPPELAATYTARQYHALIQQMPIAIVGHIFITGAILAGYWSYANRAVLLAGAAALALIAAVVLAIWRRRVSGPSDAPVSAGRVWFVTANIAAVGLVDGLMFDYLFGLSGGYGRLLLVAIVAGTVATGCWLFAYMPRAAVAWAVVICGGPSVWILCRYGTAYVLLVALTAFYCIVVISSVLGTSRQFLVRLRAETEIARQRDLVDLLLHDFEEHASDWLWETDAQGRLEHVSVRLAEALEMHAAELRGLSLRDVLPLDPQRAAVARHDISDAFLAAAPFRDLVLPVTAGGAPGWWALTGKPLLDAGGRLRGWRGVGSDITVARDRELELVRVANVDSLTGAATRHRFLARLGEHFSAAGAEPCTLLLLDLDDFKTINDSLGHGAGDELLHAAAERLVQIVGPEDLLARLGGDEFGIVHSGAATPSDAHELAERARSALQAPFALDGRRIEVRASVGICRAPADAATVQELLRRCDMALHSAKAAGRDAIRHFEPDMEARADSRLAILADLREGLHRGEFHLQYQPQVEVASGEVTGYEALVRWRHPTRGVVPPLDFISLAEESGLIEPLGAWVLRRACEDALSFAPNTTVAVNVSARQFENPQLPDLVAEALRTSGLPANRLVVEITESLLMHDQPALRTSLEQLRAHGVQIALDDFGTGYSSLSYLPAFPLDKLKIDRSFVRDLGSDHHGASGPIAKAIIDVATALKLETIAEGIETEAQLEYLRAMRCTHVQGFLLARPMDRDAAAAFRPASAVSPRTCVTRATAPPRSGVATRVTRR